MPWNFWLQKNGVLNIDFRKGAEKISEVKVGGKNKYLPTRPTPGASVLTGLSQQFSFDLQL